MDNTNMSLKTRLSEVLETLTLIILLYAIFLAILGIIIKNTELIIQTCIMFVVYVIFEYLNCSGKCVAVGDNDNDIELLKEADIGVVVANGSPAAKAVAQYECQENGTLGVLELVRTIKEANRYC